MSPDTEAIWDAYEREIGSGMSMYVNHEEALAAALLALADQVVADSFPGILKDGIPEHIRDHIRAIARELEGRE